MVTIRDAGSMAVAVLAACLSGCGDDKPAAPPSGAAMVHYVASDTCLRDTDLWEPERESEDEAKVRIDVYGLTIRVTHANAFLNCCLDSIIVGFSQDGWRLLVEEDEAVTQPCDCICEYATQARIEVTRPGTYTLEIWTRDSLVWTGTVHVPRPRP